MNDPTIYRDGGKYPVDPKDPVGSRAWDELMRVTGMGKYAQDVRGGPPNPPRKTIPADPERDTDIVIGAALRERDALLAVAEAAREWATCDPDAKEHCSGCYGGIDPETGEEQRDCPGHYIADMRLGALRDALATLDEKGGAA